MNISNLKMEITEGIESLRLQLTNTDHQSPRADQNTDQSNIYALAASIVQSEMSGANMIASITLLESLVFEEMEYRYSSIREAHPKFFEHVLDSRIIPWLQSNELLFWISGKPGSGKSTLMKFLADDPRKKERNDGPQIYRRHRAVGIIKNRPKDYGWYLDYDVPKFYTAKLQSIIATHLPLN
ncbi:hypothetical protein BS50DRAFT_152841 [Corynespora cassiicola Philippines]|uniref:Nephrocystin 3-like N-terminal domain-containing protein n=1 Tax=Corynespora cassiicola Philippines TaxID=1448308 RepID=A0A2T2N7V4_CORCC|nr:hypothetical protein BS50DRAFT_152841 [Corynespora cassiicola Philippines]